MLVVLALVVGAAIVTVAAPGLLAGGAWRIRRPQLALSAWIVALAVAVTCLAVSVVVAATIVAAAAAGRADPTQNNAAPDGGIGIGSVAATLFVWGALASAGGIVALLIARAEPIGVARNRSESAIAILAARAAYRTERIGNHEVVFVDTDLALACSTADGRILISKSVEQSMSPLCVRAIVEHERAHVRLRHDFVMRVAQLNEAAFPFLSSARAFRRTVALLIELVADDEAARLVGPATVCNALTAMTAIEPDPGLALRAERIARLPVRTHTDLGRLAPVVSKRRD